MITEEQAKDFAHDWIDAWNAHDLDRIMSHYDNDVEYFSPMLAELTDNSEGKLIGKITLVDYLAKGLAAYPDLEFTLTGIFVGVSSITIEYVSVKGWLAAEVFELNEHHKAVRVQCHYK